MKILITGAGGQLGREWTVWLEHKESNGAALSSSELDITDRDQVMEQLSRLRPSVVVNCAAFTDVDGAEEHPEKAMLVNRDGVRHLAEWCSDNGALMVHYSTDYVFPGKKKDLTRFPNGYPEEAERAPLNCYGKSKLAGEMVLEQSGAEYLLIRVSWLCGRHGKNFITTMLRLGRERGSVDVVNNQFGSPTWTDETVELTSKLINQGARGTFHLTSTGMISWHDLAVEVFQIAGMDVETRPIGSDQFPARARRPVFSKLATEKLRRELNSEPGFWKEGVKRLLEQLH